MAYKTHFKDRIDAGKYLASLLTEFKNKPNTIVVGIPRGGVILSHEIAKELNIPEDIIVVRKVGCPGQPEFGIGAISQTGNVVLDHHTMQRLGIKEADVADTIHKETLEAQRRLKVYREGRGPLDLKNKVVLLVDDGIATGHTTRAAVSTAKSLGAKSIVVVAPVAPRDATLKSLGADRAVVPWVPLPGQFWAVGQAYEHFGQTEDEEVIACMRELTGTGQDLRKSDGGEHSSRVYLQHSA